MSTTTSRFKKIPLGQIVQTANVAREINPVSVAWMIAKHRRGDWGNALPPEDARTNNSALQHGGRLLSAYLCPLTNKKVWIITESDRSVTTVLFPEDY